jgi:hypothetical protein
MAIRVYENHDFEGEVMVTSNEVLRLGEAKEFAIDHGCNVMIKSFQLWEFKSAVVDLKCKEKPSDVVPNNRKTVYILHP